MIPMNEEMFNRLVSLAKEAADHEPKSVAWEDWQGTLWSDFTAAYKGRLEIFRDALIETGVRSESHYRSLSYACLDNHCSLWRSFKNN